MSLIDHLTIPVSNYAASKAFYELVLAPLGVKPILEWGRACGFGRDRKPDLWIAEGTGSFQRPEHLVTITPIHVALVANSRVDVDAFHAAALAAGATDHGAPGLRPQYHPGYYGAFVLDPDGHNLEAVIHGG